MLSRPFQQGLALLITLASVAAVLSLVILPIWQTGAAILNDVNALTFEQARIDRALANKDTRSSGTLLAMQRDMQQRLLPGDRIEEAQGTLQNLLAARVREAAGSLTSMRLGPPQEKEALMQVTIDLSAALSERQLAEFFKAISESAYALSIPKVTIQKKASYRDDEDQVIIDLRILGYWQPADVSEAAGA